MTSRSAVLSAVCALGLMCSALSFAQDVTVGDLMAKGATYLSAEELKALLPGALLRYENAEYGSRKNDTRPAYELSISK
jgi:hypothetical protein